MMKKKKKINQDRKPNFRESGQLFLVRCFKCDPNLGYENSELEVSSGRCATCGWQENPINDDLLKLQQMYEDLLKQMLSLFSEFCIEAKTKKAEKYLNCVRMDLQYLINKEIDPS